MSHLTGSASPKPRLAGGVEARIKKKDTSLPGNPAPRAGRVTCASLIFSISLCFVCSSGAAEREMTLQWDHSIDAPYLQSYRIYYYTAPGDVGSLNVADYALSYKLAGGKPVPINPVTDPKTITIDKSNTQITLLFSDAGKRYYFAVAAVGTKGEESIPALVDASPRGVVKPIKAADPADAARESKKPPKEQNGVAFRGDHYVIGPEDVLLIHVWREEAFTRTLPVRIDGRISLPLIDDVQAAGLTPLQLKGVLVNRLKVFVENPNVTVTVMEANSFKVYVSGEVKLPGVQHIRSETTLVKLIIMAGGFTEWANQKKILIISRDKGVEKRTTVNYLKILDGEEPDIPVKRGDTVVVR